MDVKVICQCGAKFQFEVEPVHGRMPGPIACPVCNADATEAANAIIAQKLPAPAPASAPAQFAAAPESAIPTCPKHSSELAVAECFVCGKAICHKCMQQFGFLCSSYCKGQAEARKLPVPVFEGQVHQRARKEGRAQSMLLAGGVAVAALLFAAYLWFWFVGSRPKTAFKIETGPGTPFLAAQWIDDDRFFGITPLRVAMFEAASGKELWTLDLPKDELKGEKFPRSDEWHFAFEPRVKVVSKEIWVGLPARVLRIDAQTGKKKQELMLPARADDYHIGDIHFLAVSSNPTNDSKLLTRINLQNGQVDSEATPARTGARRVVGVTRSMPGLQNTSLSKMDPNDEEFSEFNSTSYGRDRDYVFAGGNVAHMTRRLIEERIAVQSSTKAKKGPAIIDNPNMRASQGMAAAEEFVNQGQPDTKIDESLYGVTIHRYFGGAPDWTGQVAGRPFFFTQKTVDYLVAGNTLIVFNKNNQKLWEAKLTYSISPSFWEEIDNQGGPALEQGSRLLFYDQGVLTAFDLKKGEALWRVNSVGISSLALDGDGNVYVSSTTAGPENIRYARQISFSNKIYPQILKVELKSGKVLWQSPRVGSDCMVTGGIVYTTSAQTSGVDAMASMMNRSDAALPVHWRMFRLNPSNGKDEWEYYRNGGPRETYPRQKRILLHYNEALVMLKYL